VELMRRTFAAIQPKDIVDAHAAGKELWPLFGSDTVGVIADGVTTQRAIWRGAWVKGGGETIADSKLKQANPADLKKLYMKKTWMPSKSLKTIGELLS
jgi:hypothetical protein